MWLAHDDRMCLAKRGPWDACRLMRVEVEQEQDGRWIVEVTSSSGAMAYGTSKQETVAKVEAMVLRILADKVEHGEITNARFRQREL